MVFCLSLMFIIKQGGGFRHGHVVIALCCRNIMVVVVVVVVVRLWVVHPAGRRQHLCSVDLRTLVCTIHVLVAGRLQGESIVGG